MYAHQISTVHIIGPSSTGKTTLCNAIAVKFGLDQDCYIREVARSVMTAQNFTRDDVGRLEMQSAIMHAQLAAELHGERSARNTTARMLLCDRSAVDPIVYAILTAGNDYKEAEKRRDVLLRSEGLSLAINRYRHGIVLLLAPVPEWQIDDGVRWFQESRECLNVFKDVLNYLGIAYIEVGQELRSLDGRVQKVTQLLLGR